MPSQENAPETERLIPNCPRCGISPELIWFQTKENSQIVCLCGCEPMDQYFIMHPRSWHFAIGRWQRWKEAYKMILGFLGHVNVQVAMESHFLAEALAEQQHGEEER